MRTSGAIFFSLMIASAALAQQKNQFSVFASNLAVSYTSNDGTDASAGFGIAYDRLITPRISTQLAVTSENHNTYSYAVNPDGSFRLMAPEGFHTYPIDLTARYNFINDTRWLPYFGGGLRYVAAPSVDPAFGFQNKLGLQLVGGTSFRITRSFGLVLDAKWQVSDHEQYDDPFKTTFGLLWRF